MPTGRSKNRERRKWARLEVAIPVFVRGTDDQGDPFLEFTTALNVSAGGALVAVRHSHLSPGIRISVEVPAAPWPESPSMRRTLDGELVRVQAKVDCSLAGVRFERPLLEK